MDDDDLSPASFQVGFLVAIHIYPSLRMLGISRPAEDSEDEIEKHLFFLCRLRCCLGCSCDVATYSTGKTGQGTLKLGQIKGIN